MDNLNIPRELFLGLNNSKATFQLLSSQIRTTRRMNRNIIYDIPVRVSYKTAWNKYTFIIKYSVYPRGAIQLSVNKPIDAKTRDDYNALRVYCKIEVFKPCDSLRNYFTILGLIEPQSYTDSKLGLWVTLRC
jgi:hypothetical protein